MKIGTNGTQSSSSMFSSPLLLLLSHLLSQQMLGGANWFPPSLQIGPGQHRGSQHCPHGPPGILCPSSITCSLHCHLCWHLGDCKRFLGRALVGKLCLNVSPSAWKWACDPGGQTQPPQERVEWPCFARAGQTHHRRLPSGHLMTPLH